MTDPTCPGCRQRDRRIVELERRVADLEAVGRARADAPSPAAEEGAGDESGGRVRRRVRVITDSERYRRHRWKKRSRELQWFAVWGAVITFAAISIWVIIHLSASLGSGQP
jgi:hypothetical protein